MVRSRDEQEAVTSSLKSTGGAWIAMPPEYDAFSRADLLKRLEQVRDTVLAETNSSAADVEEAYDRSSYFVDRSFDYFDGAISPGDSIGRAFVVPMRSDRLDDTYAAESIPFFPLLDPDRFGVSSEIRMRTMYGLPPTVIDTYLKSDEPTRRGVLVLCPLYADMVDDAKTMIDSTAIPRFLDQILSQTARFVRQTLSVNYAGLGAILPAPGLTDFGRKLKAIDGMSDLTTTTGHGGTVYMIGRSTLAVIDGGHVRPSDRIGVLGGAGSIGWSTIQVLRKIMPDFLIHTFDKREDRMRGLLDVRPELQSSVTIAKSVADILQQNKLIVSAITDRIDLDDALYRDIDLSGVIWIDDSQPGSVDRGQLESRGGRVIWVAGRDTSTSRFMTKDGLYTNDVGYNYGSTAGLHGSTTEFACGLEAAVVAASQNPQNAVTGPVTFADVERIGNLFEQFGVEIAPFQSFGRPVDLPNVQGC